MASCPACGRNVALSRAECFYCGAPLAPGGSVPAQADAAPPGPGPAEPSRRVLVLLDLAAATPDALGRALRLSRYEAALLARRGGLHLVRAAPSDVAEAEAERLRLRGALPLLVPEAEARLRPLVCLGGERRPGELGLRSEEGALTLRRGETFLVVRGPIAREYQPVTERRRIDTARLDDGYRIQLHRRAAERPLEIDALHFELGAGVTGSVRLEIDAWLEEVVGDAKRDDGFGRLPPVLGPAAPEPRGALAAAGSLAAAARAGPGEARALVLDNLAQFRFYSGCLAAVERRR